MPKEWVPKIIDHNRWGFILYHHRDMTGWEEFKGLLDGVPEMRLYGVVGFEQIQDIKEAEFFEFEPKDDIQEELDHLRQDFRSRRGKGDIRSGILGDVFLLLTDEARSSCGTEGSEMFYGYIWAVDPDWSLLGPDEDGYDGRMKINLTQVFWRFYEFMSSGNFTLKDIWRDFHDVNLTPKWPYW